MRVLGVYSVPTLSVLRRVRTPLHVISERGCYPSMHHEQVIAFSPETCYGYQLTILPNWILRDDEMEKFYALCRDRSVLYDLSDPTLLENTRVQEMLSCVRAISVPSEKMAQVVRGMGHRRVHVLPSLVHLPHFLHAPHVEKPNALGCFGPHDWPLAALRELHNNYPSLVFLSDTLTEDFVTQVHPHPNQYADVLRQCLIGLCPAERHSLIDPVHANEYGMLSIPVVVSASSVYDEVVRRENAAIVATTDWVGCVSKLLNSSTARAKLGTMNFKRANEQRATQQIDAYLTVYRQYAR